MEPCHDKHVALGLIVLKYSAEAFEAKRAELSRRSWPRRRTEYLAENVFWVPKEAR